ncbi:MAG: hypothetical protein RLZZ127_490 [Planctomycetota bacterium]|jgi:AraC-like DNA-binding protein
MAPSLTFPVPGASAEVSLDRCYDGPVPAGGNARAHRDPAWCAWRIRSGRVEVRWDGGSLAATDGALVLMPGGLRRDQGFAPGSRIASFRLLARRSDGMPLFAACTPVAVRPAPTWDGLVTSLLTAEPGPDQAAAMAAAVAQWWRTVLAAGWRPAGGRPRDPRLGAILALLETHAGIGPAPWERLTAATGLSRRQIDRLCRDGLGLPASAWLDARMAERAAALLADPALAVKTVAARCGFADPSHFVRWFRRQRGTTPGRARGGA